MPPRRAIFGRELDGSACISRLFVPRGHVTLRASRPGRTARPRGAGSRKFCLVTACRACREAFRPPGPSTVWSSNFKSKMNTKCITTCCSAASVSRTDAWAALAVTQAVRQALERRFRWSVPWRPRWAAQRYPPLARTAIDPPVVATSAASRSFRRDRAVWQRNRARVAGPATVRCRRAAPTRLPMRRQNPL